MNPRNTWVWILVAAVLGVVIFGVNHLDHPDNVTTPVILPEEELKQITTVTVLPEGAEEVSAERTNDHWLMTSRSLRYPAQDVAVEGMLLGLSRLRVDTVISASYLREHPDATENYHLDEPQFAVTVEGKSGRRQFKFGTHTAPGDQVFLQVVGNENVYVVTADILKLLPRMATDWRDRALVDLHNLVFDGLQIVQPGIVIELQVDATNLVWRLVKPLPARADTGRINQLLAQLHALRVTSFVTDDPAADRERFGLKPAALELALTRGTNQLVRLQFGTSPTNDATQIFALRDTYPTVVTVPAEAIVGWKAAPNDFRDHQLVAVPPGVEQLQFEGAVSFNLERQSNVWRVVGEEFPVDAGGVEQLLQNVNTLRIVDFKDNATEPELPTYGLAPPAWELTIRGRTNGAAATNGTSVRLSFGAVQAGRTFVRRSDERSVYAVDFEEVRKLPLVSWKLRDRRIWHIAPSEVSRVHIRQGDQTRTLVHYGTNSWTAPGTESLYNDPAVEETVHRLGQLAATLWVARFPHETNTGNDPSREKSDQLKAFGIDGSHRSLTLELVSGEKVTVEIGRRASSGYPYAAVVLDGETWVFEMDLALAHFIETYFYLPGTGP